MAIGLEPADPALAQALGQTIAGNATLSWQEGDDALRIPKLVLNGEDFGAETKGVHVTGLSTGITVSGGVTATLGDITRFSGLAARPLSGAAVLQAKGEASLLGGSFDLEGTLNGTDLSFDQNELDNLLRGNAEIAFSAKRDETGTTIRSLNIAASTLDAKLSGTIATAGTDLSGDLAFRDLSVLGNGYRGALTATTRVSGTVENAAIALQAKGNGLAIGQPQVDGLLRGDSTIDLDAQAMNGVVDLRKLRVTAASLQADVTGRVDPKGMIWPPSLISAICRPWAGNTAAV